MGGWQKDTMGIALQLTSEVLTPPGKQNKSTDKGMGGTEKEANLPDQQSNLEDKRAEDTETKRQKRTLMSTNVRL